MADRPQTAKVVSLERKRHARKVIAAFLALQEAERQQKLLQLQSTREKAKKAL